MCLRDTRVCTSSFLLHRHWLARYQNTILHLTIGYGAGAGCLKDTLETPTAAPEEEHLFTFPSATLQGW